jgi:hypothetical protein
MQLHTLERRLELLKGEGNGLNTHEIVQELMAKFGCSRSTAYNDFATKPEWQPILQELAKQLLKVQNRHEQLYRKASFMYTQAKSDRARIAALNLMRQINVESAQLSGAKPTEQVPSEDIRIKWEDPEVCKKQYASDTNPIQDNANSTTAPQGSECSTADVAGAKPSQAPTNS